MLFELLGKLVMEEKLLAFLERLFGAPVDPQQRFTVSSIQRAQIFAWLGDNGVAADINRNQSRYISIGELLGTSLTDADAAPGTEPGGREAPMSRRAIPMSNPGGLSVAPLGLGVDLHARAAMPEATDFRGTPFYARNFSERELAYAIEQGDPIETLCGLWAAKEAVVKAGAAQPARAGQFGDVEIGRDPAGAPTYTGCLVSISHEAGLAVAVCVRYA
ncbi:MAG: 4'-phosphopantetheinyl transferase superfamily protein [Pseudomonadota bacterium]|nr:4'-phosphopantetheinyl transferase superfamily protein [Pseudomonadota bacterium]